MATYMQCNTIVSSKVGPDVMNMTHLKAILMKLVNLKDQTYIEVKGYFWLDGSLEPDKEELKDKGEPEETILSYAELDVLNDVLYEIENYREYPGDDGKALNKLKELFNCDLVEDESKKVKILIEDNKSVKDDKVVSEEIILSHMDSDVLNDVLCSLNRLVSLFDKAFLKAYEAGKAELKLIIEKKV
jgi:hypothetical protein